VQNIHAIGDRANGMVLNAFEVAAKKHKVNVASLRPRIEHVQIITKPDAKRLGKLGGEIFAHVIYFGYQLIRQLVAVIASIQPSHA
jgi:predicted amidohydrolase YtcJ